MNICDLALLLALIFILGFPLTGGFTKNIEINREKIELKKRSQSFQFIAQSFRHTCSDSGFSNLEEWKETCKDLWNLDEIIYEVKRTDSGQKVFYGKWSGPSGEGEVYERG